MSIWRTEVTTELLERFSRGTFAERIGIRITEVGPDYLRATLPVTAQGHRHRAALSSWRPQPCVGHRDS
jgi:1,4-dihydroxy-2-naphthoyl-CoA hydrolase